MADEAAAQAAPAASAPSSSAAPPAPASTSTSAPETTSAQPTPSSAPSPSTAAAKPERPAYIPESYWDPEGGKVKGDEFGNHYKELATFKATEDSRRLTLPKSADEYQPQLPKDFQAPQGIEFKLNPADPLMAQAKQLMHDIDSGKVSGQAAFEKMLALHAGGQIANTQMLQTARDGEIAKLGAAGPARVTAAQAFLNAQLGEELGGFMGNMMVTARHIEGFEKLMASFRNQGAGTFTPPRAPDAPARPTPEQYAKMTYAEKVDYAARANGAGRSH